MADHAMPEYATATGNDYPMHEHTYANVVKLAKVGSFTAITLLVSMAAGLVADHVWLFVLGFILMVVSLIIGLASERGRVGPLVGTIVLVLILWAIVS
ncbi:MAG TPA: aa3-type cytochrome c oxidase subunit IV [Hyphomicrobiales bacterium]|nr:aa3-type cytochrome c oxidase subunit IV [Hyphomicrobiales bacterium]